MNNEASIMTTCPICQEPFKKARPWQEVCSPVCRRKKWLLKMVKRVLDQAYAKTYAELEEEIKTGSRF